MSNKRVLIWLIFRCTMWQQTCRNTIQTSHWCHFLYAVAFESYTYIEKSRTKLAMRNTRYIYDHLKSESIFFSFADVVVCSSSSCVLNLCIAYLNHNVMKSFLCVCLSIEMACVGRSEILGLLWLKIRGIHLSVQQSG